MPHLFTKTLPAFGLDISESSIKILQLIRKGTMAQVKAFTDIPLTKGLIINDAIADPNTFEFLMKQNLSKMQYGSLTTRNAVVSVPESKSFVRVIQIPRMSDAEAENAIPFEAESFIPLPIDQVYLDWQKLSEAGDKMNILIIAAPKEYVDKYLGAIEKAGIKPLALEVESQSCHRSLIPRGSNETALITDLDAVRTNLIMVEDGNIQFTSSIPVAGNTFTDAIAKSLGVSAAKAEAVKKKVGIANTPEYPNVKTALIPTLNNLSAEIKNILKFHNEHSDRQVSKILLAGGGAKMKNFVEYLTPEFQDFPGLSIELSNPWINVTPPEQVPLDPYESLGLTTVIGLGMRGIEYEIQ